MRPLILVALLTSTLTFKTYAQYKPEKKSALKAQLGVASVWFSYEHPLFNSVSARFEVGLGTWETPFTGNWIPTYYTPRLNFQARWYYSANSRIAKGKTNKHFSGAFLSLGATQEIRKASDGSTWSTIHFAPQIGYSGTLGSNINYEFSIGPGLEYNSLYNTWNFVPKGTVRFGYTF